MKYLVAGLGNIGSEYAHTRHNIGFDVLDALAGASNIYFEDGRYAFNTRFSIKGRTIVLIKPTTYMNLSGKAVSYWLQKENIPVENLLVVVDDLALPVGAIRIRPKGGDGGHNGLKNIQEMLGHANYARLRFGIGSEFAKGRQVDFVLGKWAEEEKALIKPAIETSCEVIKSFVLAGLERTMTSFNK
ncbi:MAG TPA: aminoacyl-tRNA hydrolase [Bacteroidales bacterium]|nr:aminoacyl-tRNA hydrolase [Bacteroidales bacterium]